MPFVKLQSGLSPKNSFLSELPIKETRAICQLSCNLYTQTIVHNHSLHAPADSSCFLGGTVFNLSWKVLVSPTESQQGGNLLPSGNRDWSKKVAATAAAAEESRGSTGGYKQLNLSFVPLLAIMAGVWLSHVLKHLYLSHMCWWWISLPCPMRHQQSNISGFGTSVFGTWGASAPPLQHKEDRDSDQKQMKKSKWNLWTI